MTTTRRGSIPELGTIGDSWVLVFGGVTPVGNRRARRAVERACNAGLDVVWFDGFEETDPPTGERVPLQFGNGPLSENAVAVVGIKNDEMATLSGRIRLGAGWRSTAVGRALWGAVGRRLGAVLRPRNLWRVTRDGLEALTGLPEPEAIIYCDEYAITSAWRAGRVWESAPIVSGLPEPRG